MSERTKRLETAQEFEWHSVSRSQDGRSYRRLTVLVICALLLGFAGLSFVVSPASADTSFTANDATVTSPDGSVKSVTIAPAGTVTYSGMEQEPSGISVTVSVKTSSMDGWKTVESKSLSVSGLEGSASYRFQKSDLLASTVMSASSFEAADGSTATTDVQVKVTAVVVGGGSEGADVTSEATSTFTVSVTNIEAGAGVGGQANPKAN